MLQYDKYPLNAWVYGLSLLALLILPMLVYLLGSNALGDFFEYYMSLMFFPYGLSATYLFGLPYVGIILLILSFVLHAHIYCTIIERTSVILSKKLSGK